MNREISPNEFTGIEFIRNRVHAKIEDAYRQEVARWAIDQLDMDRCKSLDRWRCLDSDTALLNEITCNTAIIEKFFADAAKAKEFREAVCYPSENGKRPVPTTEERLRATCPIFQLYIPPSPKSVMPSLWPAIATAIENELISKAGAIDEWQLLNRLLLIEFFTNCRLTLAGLVEQQLAKLARPVLSVRGSLTRIPSNIPRATDPGLILEQMPSVVQPIRSNSLLAKATEQIFEDLRSRKGAMHRFCGAVESDAFRSVPDEQKQVIVQGRSRDFAMFEANASILLLSAMAEQTIRSHAERLGLDNTKPDRPVPVLRVAKRLIHQNDIGQQAGDACKDLFDSKRGNIRNRIAHGAWVDTEAKYLEAILDHGGEWGDLPRIDAGTDPYSPHAVACHVAKLASVIIMDVESRGTTLENHSCWTEWFNVADIAEHGRQLGCEILNSSDEGNSRTRRVNQFLKAVVPVADLYHRVTVLGWLKDRSPTPTSNHDFVIALYFSQTVFETLFRSVASVLGNSILQRNLLSDGTWNFVYKMISRDNNGLGTPAIIRQICKCLAVQDRVLAEQTIGHAIRLRDAVAHGAIMRFSADQRFGLFNVYWKTVELLCEACETQFVRESAYAKYVDRGVNEHGHDKEDWESAERDIDELLRDRTVSPDRYGRSRQLGLLLPNSWQFCPTY